MLLNIIIGLIGLGFVVIVHETGHLFASRAVGIEVETFSVGWGKRLWGIMYKGTEYRISMFPIGGFVRLKGMDAHRTSYAKEHNKLPDIKGGFFSAHPLKRIVVAIGGPATNIVVALIIMTIIFAIGFNYQSYGNKIVLVSEVDGQSYPADLAGLQTGDVITAVGERPVRYFTDIRQHIATSDEEMLILTIERDGQTIATPVTLMRDNEGIPRLGVYPWTDPIITHIRPDSPADIAGIEVGDRIIEIDNVEIAHSVDVSNALTGKNAVEVLVEREARSRAFTLPVGEVADANSAGEPDIGVAFAPQTVRQPAARIDRAIADAAAQVGEIFALTFRGISLLFTGVRITDTVAGPIRLTSLVGEATRSGDLGFFYAVRRFFDFIALISVALAIMNLLPIPILDGGQIVVYLYELFRHKPLTPKLLTAYQMVGGLMVMALLVLAIFSDIFFLFQN